MNEVVIKRGLRVGDLDAETDWDLAKECFVDNGDLEILTDVRRPESIVLGRTGAGKSAILLAVRDQVDKSVLLDPNDISIRYLEHSDIIQFFEQLGVNLELFYKLLWKHILTVEFLKMRYKLGSEAESNVVWLRLTGLVDKDPIKKEALEYFKEWGSKFWLDTDQQLKEVTEKLARDIKAGIGGGLNGVDISLHGAKALSTEKRTEIVHKANRVVSGIQITKLSRIINMLEEYVFDDRQKSYYLLIDKLDEDWADTSTRYKFIRALIEEIKSFRKISNVKIVIALRKDLLDSVFNHTRDAGFQQEKYESYILPLTWTKDALGRLISLRINEVYKRQYTKQGVRFDDVFPSPKGKQGGQAALDYILERTLYRPRDVMQYINECFIAAAAVNAPRVSWRAITAAEANYSEKRLNSLYEEWSEIYPGLKESIDLLRSMPYVFKRSNIAERINSAADRLFEYSSDPCGRAVIDYCSEKKTVNESDVVAEFINCFYRIGAIGVKMSTTEPYIWADYDRAVLSKSEIKRVNQIKIHKMLGRSLGICEPIEGATL